MSNMWNFSSAFKIYLNIYIYHICNHWHQRCDQKYCTNTLQITFHIIGIYRERIWLPHCTCVSHSNLSILYILTPHYRTYIHLLHITLPCMSEINMSDKFHIEAICKLFNVYIWGICMHNMHHVWSHCLIHVTRNALHMTMTTMKMTATLSHCTSCIRPTGINKLNTIAKKIQKYCNIVGTSYFCTLTNVPNVTSCFFKNKLVNISTN